MHTKKRHQNMFQDLNRKLHHAEKDRESPASDSKVTYDIMLIIHFHRHSFSGNVEQIMGNITEAVLMLKWILLYKNDLIKQPVICVLNYGCHYFEVI